MATHFLGIFRSTRRCAMTPNVWWVLVRTFATAAAIAFWLGVTLGPDWVIPMFGAFAFLLAGIFCWLRVGIGP